MEDIRTLFISWTDRMTAANCSPYCQLITDHFVDHLLDFSCLS
jgi:hypothetical protein